MIRFEIKTIKGQLSRSHSNYNSKAEISISSYEGNDSELFV